MVWWCRSIQFFHFSVLYVALIILSLHFIFLCLIALSWSSFLFLLKCGYFLLQHLVGFKLFSLFPCSPSFHYPIAIMPHRSSLLCASFKEIMVLLSMKYNICLIASPIIFSIKQSLTVYLWVMTLYIEKIDTLCLSYLCTYRCARCVSFVFPLMLYVELKMAILPF